MTFEEKSFEEYVQKVSNVILKCYSFGDFVDCKAEYEWLVKHQKAARTFTIKKWKSPIISKYIPKWKIDNADVVTAVHQKFLSEVMTNELHGLYDLTGRDANMTYILYDNQIKSIKNLIGIPANIAICKGKLPNKVLSDLHNALELKHFSSNARAIQIGNAICETQWNYLKGINPKLQEVALFTQWFIKPELASKIDSISDKHLYTVDYCAPYWFNEKTNKLEQLFSIKPGELEKSAYWGFTEHIAEAESLVHNFNDSGKHSVVMHSPDMSIYKFREKADTMRKARQGIES